MANIYVGDRSRVDPKVLEAIKQLPDDFWVFAEFGVGRNIDWLIVRAFPDSPATMIVTETKRVARRLWGDENGPWKEETGPNEWQPLNPSNQDDVNPYWQAVNASNEMQQWLWNNQPRYRSDPTPLEVSDTKVWPDLLLLSPPGVRHLLPFRPASGYGRWFYSIDEWIAHVVDWRPRVGMQLTDDEIRRLADALEVAPLEPEAEATTALSLEELASKVAQLEARVRTLETTPVARQANGSGGLTDDIKEALREAVAVVRRTGRSRATPSILEALKTTLGYDLKQTNYAGYGTASAFFDHAKEEGVVQFGPLLGPNPTIFLPDEGEV